MRNLFGLFLILLWIAFNGLLSYACFLFNPVFGCIVGALKILHFFNALRAFFR